MGPRDIEQTGALNWGVSYTTIEGDMVAEGFGSEREALDAADQYEKEGKTYVKVYH